MSSAPPPKPRVLVNEKDVFVLTDAGKSQLHRTGTQLTPEELGILVMIDGKASAQQIAHSARGWAAEAVMDTLSRLLQSKLIMLGSEVKHDHIDAGDFFSVTQPLKFSSEADQAAADEIGRGVSSLQTQGYYVRIARRSATERKATPGARMSALIIEDEAQMAKLLATYLKLEGFSPRVAATRDDIAAAFGEAAAPDLVLLDVTLPDVDGFDVLGRMRQHPLLKNTAVIMLTAKATREAVLKGLQGGADGYITKPFEIDVLMQAVKTVMGLTPPPAPPPPPDKTAALGRPAAPLKPGMPGKPPFKK